MVTLLLLFGISYFFYRASSKLPKDLAQGASSLFSLGIIFGAISVGKLFDTIFSNEQFWPSFLLLILFASLSVLCFWGLKKIQKDFKAKYFPDSESSVTTEKSKNDSHNP